MAIETMDVGEYNVNELYDAIVDFINHHHPELFDHFSKSSNGYWCNAYITNRLGNAERVFTIFLDRSDDYVPFQLDGTTTYGDAYIPSGTTYGGVKKLYSTDNGIMVTWKEAYNYDGSTPRRTSFIATIEPGYGLVMHGMDIKVSYTTPSGQARVYTINGSTEGLKDFVNGYGVEHCCDVVQGSNNKHILPEYCRPATKTMMIPMVLSSGYVCQNIFRQVYSENPGTEGVFTLGGTRFVTNGYFALKD